MSHKLAKLAFWLIPMVCLSLSPITLIAQGEPEKKAEKSAHAQTVTGCLQKADASGEFSITGEDGKTWGLRIEVKSGRGGLNRKKSTRPACV